MTKAHSNSIDGFGICLRCDLPYGPGMGKEFWGSSGEHHGVYKNHCIQMRHQKNKFSHDILVNCFWNQLLQYIRNRIYEVNLYEKG